MTDAAEQYFDKLYPNGEFKLASTDPEFADFFANFSGDEVVNQDDLDDRTRMMAVLAALLGCQGVDEFREILPGALNLGLTPVEVKEIVYQASSGPEESRHINRWLSGNCFGDYYTRTGLDHRQREMITFCFLAAQGGCEPQLTSHAAGNMKVGNDKAFLIKIISQCLPYIGYPRSLNALRCVNEAAGQQ